MKIVQHVVQTSPDGKSVSTTQIIDPGDSMTVGQLQDALREHASTWGGYRFPGDFIIVLDAFEGGE